MATHGRKAQLFIAKTPSTTPPSTEADWLEIELAREGTFNRQKGAVEVSTRKSGGDEEYIPGLRSATYDITALLPSTADPGIKALMDNYYADEEITWFRDRPHGTGTSLPETTFRGFVTNEPVAMPGKEAVTIQATIQVTGKPVPATQAGA